MLPMVKFFDNRSLVDGTMPRFLKTVNLLFKSKRKKYDQAASLYQIANRQSRNPVFYDYFEVPDTIEGRFDLLSLHIILIMRRLPPESPLVQELFDYFFEDMDFSLREMGVSDMKVGRYVKKLAKNFLGVFDSYNRAFKQPSNFKTALWRNLYGGQLVDEWLLEKLYEYCQASDSLLKTVDLLHQSPPWAALLNEESNAHAA